MEDQDAEMQSVQESFAFQTSNVAAQFLLDSHKNEILYLFPDRHSVLAMLHYSYIAELAKHSGLSMAAQVL